MYSFSNDKNPIGSGAHSQVFEATDCNNDQVAVKKLMNQIDEEGIHYTALREISTLKNLKNHENIISIKDVVIEKDFIMIVMELMAMQLRPGVAAVRSTMKKIIQGVAHIHANGFMHRDLKPPNILMSKDGSSIKIADFGQARQIGTHRRRNSLEVCTIWYRAPEIMLGDEYYTQAVDMWSVGCIFYFLLTGAHMFTGDMTQLGQLITIFKVLGTPNNLSWQGVESLPNYHSTFPRWETKPPLFKDSDCSDLLSKLMTYPPNRISAREALLHPYFGPDLGPDAFRVGNTKVGNGVPEERVASTVFIELDGALKDQGPF